MILSCVLGEVGAWEEWMWVEWRGVGKGERETREVGSWHVSRRAVDGATASPRSGEVKVASFSNLFWAGGSKER